MALLTYTKSLSVMLRSCDSVMPVAITWGTGIVGTCAGVLCQEADSYTDSAGALEAQMMPPQKRRMRVRSERRGAAAGGKRLWPSEAGKASSPGSRSLTRHPYLDEGRCILVDQEECGCACQGP